MTPEPTSPDREGALALIAGIERASRRSRPFFLFGLLAVILGFATVSVYLYQDRQEERAQKAVLKNQVDELSGTLNQARALLPDLDESPAARARLRGLLMRASDTARELPAAVAAAETGTPAPAVTPRSPPPQPRDKPRPPPGPVEGAAAPPTPPGQREAQPAALRIIIYISEDSQLPMAWELGARLNRALPDGTRITAGPPAPGRRRRTNSLRCFHVEDCRRLAEVSRFVQARLVSPTLRAFREFDRLEYPPPGTFEIWFAPGPITPILD